MILKLRAYFAFDLFYLPCKMTVCRGCLKLQLFARSIFSAHDVSVLCFPPQYVCFLFFRYSDLTGITHLSIVLTVHSLDVSQDYISVAGMNWQIGRVLELHALGPITFIFKQF